MSLFNSKTTANLSAASSTSSPFSGNAMSFDSFYGLFNQTHHEGNLAYAVALYAQARLESGNFGSQLYADYNNMFGMKCSSQRERFWDSSVTLQGETFATYASPMQSLLDRLDWDDYNGIATPENPEDISSYYTVVKQKGYATDPQYVNKLLGVVASLEDEIGGFDGDDFSDVDQPGSIAGFPMKFVWWIIGAVVVFILFKRFKR